MNYYIADLHLGHSNIIRLSKRPFKTVDEMDKTIIKNWNSRVKDNDNVYILGDFAYKTKNIEEYLKQLKGNKYLIVGNHDKTILRDKRLRKYFVTIKDILMVEDQKTQIVLCHYPMVEWEGYYRNVLHFYGHIHNSHNNPTNKYIESVPNAYNVGVDILGFFPRTLKEIIKS